MPSAAPFPIVPCRHGCDRSGARSYNWWPNGRGGDAVRDPPNGEVTRGADRLTAFAPAPCAGEDATRFRAAAPAGSRRGPANTCVYWKFCAAGTANEPAAGAEYIGRGHGATGGIGT
jgi:hypothetical protein